MPTYEYVCESCGTHVEVFQRFSEESLTECGVCSGLLRKVFHPAGILFKGSGFYVTDSRSGGKSAAARSGEGASKGSTGTSESASGSATSSSGGASSGSASSGDAGATSGSAADASSSGSPSKGSSSGGSKEKSA